MDFRLVGRGKFAPVQKLARSESSLQQADHSHRSNKVRMPPRDLSYNVKKVSDIPVPSRDVTYAKSLNAGGGGELRDLSNEYGSRIFKLLRSPRIDSKESSASLRTWRAGATPYIPTRFLAPIDCLKIPAQLYTGLWRSNSMVIEHKQPFKIINSYKKTYFKLHTEMQLWYVH